MFSALSLVMKNKCPAPALPVLLHDQLVITMHVADFCNHKAHCRFLYIFDNPPVSLLRIKMERKGRTSNVNSQGGGRKRTFSDKWFARVITFLTHG